MSTELDLEADFIEQIAHTASRRYKRYSVKKRDGGVRTIFHPSREVKSLQRWILREILSRFQVHESAYAYEPESNIAKHARFHASSRFLLRMDFKDFFPSISSEDIRQYLVARMHKLPEGWSSEDTDLLCQIICLRDKLTIGSVTSPSLSNRICCDLDVELYRAAIESGARYSRYADDLYFSSSLPNVLESLERRTTRVVEELRCPADLRVNSAKTLHLSKKQRRVVTGIVITPDGGVSIGRCLKRRMRGMVHRFEQLDDDEKKWLRGMIAHSRGVEPEFLGKLYIKFGDERVDAIIKELDGSPRRRTDDSAAPPDQPL